MNPTAATTDDVTITRSARPPRGALCLRRTALRFEVEAVGPGDRRRDDLERYVRAAFATKHGAEVRTFMPTLLEFRDRITGGLCGVAGVRGAHGELLYLEQYLDAPIESALAAAIARTPRFSLWPTPAPVRRAEIVEVGNLAGRNCLAAVRMVSQLPAYLMQQRYRWIVFTATSALRSILRGLDAPLVELAAAERQRIAGASDEWGTYYDTDPRVYAGLLADAEGLAGFSAGSEGH